MRNRKVFPKFDYDYYYQELPVFSALNLLESRRSIFASQAQAAKLCHVKVRTWRAWEWGHRFMPDVAWAYWLVQRERVWKGFQEKYPYLKKTGTLVMPRYDKETGRKRLSN